MFAAFRGFGGALDAFLDSDLAALEKRVRETAEEIASEANRFTEALNSSLRDLERSSREHLQVHVWARLARIRLSDLKGHLPKGTRLQALAQAGVESLADVASFLSRGGTLMSLHGVGEGTASALRRALEAFHEEEVRRGAPIPRTPAKTDAEARLLAAAANLARCRQEIEVDLPRVQGPLKVMESSLTQSRTGLGGAISNFFQGRSGSEAKAELRSLDLDLKALRSSREFLRIREARGRLITDPSVLRDANRASEALSGLSADIVSIISRQFERLGVKEETGSLPEQLARAVEKYPLHEELRARTLRPYQAFGAKYLLLQERTLLGDDMGLGKTIQALAAFVHCNRKEGARHFLVVCPLGVLGNWMREADDHTHLSVYRLHGASRDEAARQWIRRGGIALTSYGTLGSLGLQGRLPSLDFLVADEAHYLKNPDSKRSRAFAGLVHLAKRLSLMTGTPLENHPGEILNLLDLAHPDLAKRLRGGLMNTDLVVPNPVRMRTELAPAYLRRNRGEVLHELPEETTMDEGIQISWSERLSYWGLLETGRRRTSIHDLRRLLITGEDSTPTAKVQRLEEILEDYERDGFKVVVFSYYRNSLAFLEERLSERFEVVGTITGDLSDTQRLSLIDRLRAAHGTAVLLSQFTAGGVGLNMQCANVCIIAEPQWKPTDERQAISRLSRIGQERPVFIHRMVAEDTVDERVEEVQAQKGVFFELYAEQSAVASSSREATEAVWSKKIVEFELARMEEQRRAGQTEDL